MGIPKKKNRVGRSAPTSFLTGITGSFDNQNKGVQLAIGQKLIIYIKS